MKASFLRTISVVVFLGLLCQGAWAQNKTQAYYNSHEEEILPDARTAFKNGRYDRAVELCRLHYIIVGDQRSDALLDQARRCGEFVRQMNDLKNQGKTDDAKAIARQILSLNPDDPAVKQWMKEMEELEKAAQVEPEPEPEPEPESVPADTAVVGKAFLPSVENEPDPEIAPVADKPVPPVIPETVPVKKPKKAPKNNVVIKVGATLLDLDFSKITPGGSIGLYSIGGSRVGMEAGFLVASGLAEKTASLYEADAALVLRLSSGVYPKAGAGFFSGTSTETGSGTKGICGVGSFTFLLGDHFAIEIGAKYYPSVKVGGMKTLSTAGLIYDFPISLEIISGGIAPFASIGWAF